MGANAQVALEKFARYFDVECRLVPISVRSKYRLDPKEAMKYVDENTIGVFVILGSVWHNTFLFGNAVEADTFKALTQGITSQSRRCRIS